MYRNARVYRMIIGLVNLLLLFSAAAQEGTGFAGGGVPGRVAGGGVPGAPGVPKPRAAATLITPADGAQIRARTPRSTAVLFTWSAPSGEQAPEHYRLCVVEPSVSCSSRDAALYEVGRVKEFRAELPPRFHGKRLQWSVALCGAAKSSSNEAERAADTDCTWSAPRNLAVAALPAAEPRSDAPVSVIAPCD